MKDIANKSFEHVEGPKTLEIVPDYDSLRLSTWTKNEAFVLCNVDLPYYPRNVLRSALKSYPDVVKKVQIQELSIQLMKVDQGNGEPPLCDQLTSTNQGILMTDTVHDGILTKIRNNLN